MWKNIIQTPWALLSAQIRKMRNVPNIPYFPGLNIKIIDKENALLSVEPLGWRIFIIEGRVYYLIQSAIPFFCGPSAEGYGSIDPATGDIEYKCLPRHKDLEHIINLQKEESSKVYVELEDIKAFKRDVMLVSDKILNSWYVVDFVNYASYYDIIQVKSHMIDSTKRNTNDNDHSATIHTYLPYNKNLKRKLEREKEISKRARNV